MLVIRDALLLQLQKDRLRQEIIMAELAKLESAMALRSAARHGIDTAFVEQPKPLFFTFNEEFMPYFRWPEHCSDVDGIHDPKKKDGKHGGVQSKSGKPASKDRFCVCSRPCCSNGKSEEENEAFDEKKLQESNEPKKTPSSLKWELTGITIPVKKTKLPQSWSCAICQVGTPNTEHNIQEHCAGKKHRSNVASLESRNKAISQKAQTTAESSSCAGQKTSSIKWSCSMCQANGSSEADLKEHLSGRTHQQIIEAQCQEGDGMAKNTEPQEAKCHKSHVQQPLEKPPSSICQDNCTADSELGSLVLAKIQALLDAINNMATNSESHEAKLPPNNVRQDAEKTSESNCSIYPTGSDHQSCCSEPQSANPRRIRKRRKKRGTLQVEGQEAEPSDMKPADKISSYGSCSKSASSEEKQASYHWEVCNLDLNSESGLANHCDGEEHLEKQKLLNFCEVCNLQCNSRQMFDHHCTGKKHRKNLDANK
ncbi:hypothetical protein PAHAL_2G268500 [Panicum hallii]|nr:zinc finger RNA-binding protein-like isoform X2 [Panicum hallii]XP_025800339.1 zinc finger RNA-binding protein-like isoform X2 [Panicum hallii]PAN12487.1 hypothetical protein PAHAL_2G268500 [Panicum hallii]PAN12488.1 hypothetical protein PAHAL_2G268500 [Panicum hallii]